MNNFTLQEMYQDLANTNTDIRALDNIVTNLAIFINQIGCRAVVKESRDSSHLDLLKYTSFLAEGIAVRKKIVAAIQKKEEALSNEY